MSNQKHLYLVLTVLEDLVLSSLASCNVPLLNLHLNRIYLPSDKNLEWIIILSRTCFPNCYISLPK